MHSDPIPAHSILMSFFYLRLGLFNWYLPFRFKVKILYAFLISILRTTYTANVTVLDLISITLFYKEYVLWRSLCNFVYSPLNFIF